MQGGVPMTDRFRGVASGGVPVRTRGCRGARLAARLAAMAALAGIDATGGTMQITLKEHLNRAWAHEVLSYPVTFPQAACVPASVRLSGPAGPLPVQLYDVDFWPDSAFVRTARVAFAVASLAPLATHPYAITYGPEAAVDPMPVSGLEVEDVPDGLLAVSRVSESWEARPGVRLRTGGAQYEPALPAAEVPGPVMAFYNVDGAVFGGSRLYGETRVSSFAAEVLDRGPVFARVRYRYDYEDGSQLQITVRLDAREGAWLDAGEAFQISFDTAMTGNLPDDGWDLLLSPVLPQAALQFLPEAASPQSGTTIVEGYKAKAIADYPAGVVTWLTPWGDWWNEFTQPLFYLHYPSPAGGSNPPGRLLRVLRTQPGAWTDPGPPGSMQPWERFAPKQVPLVKGTDDSLYLRVNNVDGRRHWSITEQMTKLRVPVLGAQNAMPGEAMLPLDTVKDLVLDWPDGDEAHPRLFLSAEELAQAGTAQPAALASLLNVGTLRDGLGLFAYFDTMRRPESLVYQYDALIDNPAYILPAEREVLRARMALMVYRLASPANWSDERGYRSYNENMTITQVLNVGLAACALQDHPMAPVWLAYARMRFDHWLARLDETGYWNESSHYARVSISKLIFFAMALRKAGVHDYFQDARFRQMGLLYERTLLPPDPLVAAGKRLSPPLGRGSHSSNWGFGGLFARATADTDPAFSRHMQWSYAATGYGTEMGTPNPVGYTLLYPRRDLPVEQPDWRSEMIPSVGPLLRSGVGTATENYLWLVTQNPSNPDGEWWPSETGAVVGWFAHGVPLSRRFPAGSDHGLLMNRVMPASNWSPGQERPWGAESVNTVEPPVFMPHVDYVNAAFNLQTHWTRFQSMPANAPAFPVVAQEGGLPLHWRRQMLQVRDAAPDGTQYLVFRDTVTGAQPSQWQFWTHSSRVDPPDVPDGGHGAAARLLTGNRFTAHGQYNVDVEYFVAAPADTPRHTLRHSQSGHGYGVSGYTVSQNLLHLQLPGDGAYYVALLPRVRTAPAPVFTAPADGRLIRIAGAFGTDYVLLADVHTNAADEDITLEGTAGMVQKRLAGTTLTLAAAGAAHWQAYGLESPVAAALHVMPDGGLSLTLPDGSPAAEIVLHAPDLYRVAGSTGVTLTPDGTGRYRLGLPAGTTTVTLRFFVDRPPGTVLIIRGKVPPEDAD